MSLTNYIGNFELADGRNLMVEFSCHFTPASFYDPGDSDQSEATITLDGTEIDYDQLPNGLSAIVDDLLENDPPRLGGTLKSHDGRDDDDGPDPDDDICDRFYDGF